MAILPGVELTATVDQRTQPVIPQRNRNGRVNSTGVVKTADGYARTATADQLTSTQLQRLTNQANGYISNARLRGEEYAAQRGGIGGSIAAGAAERAAIEAAAPIAQANAQAEIGAASDTMQSLANQLATKTRTDAQIAAANIGAGAQIRSAEISAATSLARTRLDNAARKELAQMEFQNRKDLQLMSQEFQHEMQQMQFDWQALQNDKNRELEMTRIINQQSQFEDTLRFNYGNLAANMFSGFSNNMIANISEIISNPNLSPAQQAAGVRQVQELFGQQMVFFEPMFKYLKEMQWPPQV